MKPSTIAILASLMSFVSFSIAKSEEISCVVDVTDDRFPIDIKESLISSFTVGKVKDGMRVTIDDTVATQHGIEWSRVKDSGWLPRAALDCSKYDKRDQDIKMFRQNGKSPSHGIIGRFHCENIRESESTGIQWTNIKVVIVGGAIVYSLPRMGVNHHYNQTGDVSRADEFENVMLLPESDGHKIVMGWLGNRRRPHGAIHMRGALSPINENDFNGEWIYTENQNDLITNHQYQMRAFCHPDWVNEQGEKVDWKNN